MITRSGSVLHCEISGTCPLSCRHCYCARVAPEAQRSDAFWLKLSELAIKTGFTQIVVSGGEPLLRRNLTSELLKVFGLAGGSAILLTGGWIQDLPSEAVAAHVVVQVSIDAPSPEAHDWLRKRHGSWQKSVALGQQVVGRGGHLRVSHLLWPRTLGNIANMAELVSLIGGESLFLNPVVSGNSEQEKLILPPSSLEWVSHRLPYLQKLAGDLPIRLAGRGKKRNKRLSLRITADGWITPHGIGCSPHRQLPIGLVDLENNWRSILHDVKSSFGNSS